MCSCPVFKFWKRRSIFRNPDPAGRTRSKSNPPYCYGHEHKSIVPFDQLSKETQDRDIRYLEAIHKVAKMLKSPSPNDKAQDTKV